MSTPTHILVRHLTPNPDKRRDEWSVAREEVMEYQAYLDLDSEALANTRVKFLSPDELRQAQARAARDKVA